MTKPGAHPRISLNLISAFNWPIAQSLDLARSLGVHAISLAVHQLGTVPEEGIALVRASGLPAVTLASGGGDLIGDAATALATLTPLIDAAAALGCPSAYTLSGTSPNGMPTDIAFDRLVETIRPAVDYAHGKGVTLGIEANSMATHATGFIHTLIDSIEFARATGAGVSVELQNIWYERDLERLFREHAHRFVIVQFSDFRVGEELRYNRRVPGDGSIPLEWMIGHLLDAGYRGYFDLEIIGPAIEAEGYASAISRSIDWLSERLHTWGV